MKALYLLVVLIFFITCEGSYRQTNKLTVNMKTSNNGSYKTIYCRDKAQECHKIAMFFDPIFLMGSWMCGNIPEPTCRDYEK